MQYKIIAYSNWEKPFNFVFDNIKEAMNKKAELKDLQYKVEIEEVD